MKTKALSIFFRVVSVILCVGILCSLSVFGAMAAQEDVLQTGEIETAQIGETKATVRTDIDIKSMVKVKKYLAGIEGSSSLGLDYNRDKTVDANDIVAAKKHILGIELLYSGLSGGGSGGGSGGIIVT